MSWLIRDWGTAGDWARVMPRMISADSSWFRMPLGRASP